MRLSVMAGVAFSTCARREQRRGLQKDIAIALSTGITPDCVTLGGAGDEGQRNLQHLPKCHDTGIMRFLKDVR